MRNWAMVIINPLSFGKFMSANYVFDKPYNPGMILPTTEIPMASPALERAAAQTRTENETRQLCRTMIAAKAKWDGFNLANTAGKTEDELIDMHIGSAQAMQEYIDAHAAFHASMK